MKIGIISSLYIDYNESKALPYEDESLFKALKKFHYEYFIIDPLLVEYGIKKNSPYLSCKVNKKNIFEIIDVFYIRRTREFSEQILDMIYVCSKAYPNIKIIDPIDSYGRPLSKVESLILRTDVLNQPDTLIYSSKQLKNFNPVNFPFVAKPTHGHKGIKVELIHDENEWERYLDNVSNKANINIGYGTFIQQYIPFDNEYRIFIVNKKVLGAAKKNAPNNNIFPKNAHQASRWEGVQIENIPEITNLALKTSIQSRQFISGIDIARFKDEIIVLECNRNPEFTEFDRATNSNTAEVIVKEIKSICNLSMKKPNNKPVVFIGSSSEGRYIVDELTQLLSDKINPLPWTYDTFNPSDYVLESLEKKLNNASHSILIFTPDDDLEKRGSKQKTPRDNVIFELGLSIGLLGRKNVVVINCKGSEKQNIMTDINGINYIEIDFLNEISLEIPKIRAQLVKFLAKK